MWFFKKQVTLNIGSETDDTLLKKLKEVLESNGAELIKEDSVFVGSQEIQFYDYRIEKDKIRITIETYVGISLMGKESIVKKIVCDLPKSEPTPKK